MKRISLLSIAHDLVRDALKTGDIAIDATVGNGNDTLFLLQQVQPSGKVFGFDIQQAALDSTRTKLCQVETEDCLILFRCSHAEMAEKIPLKYHGKISACMFNLGYLPGGNKGVTTQPESTHAALETATRLLTHSGLITVVAYPGHPGGNLETEQLQDWCTQLNPDQFEVNTIFSEVHHKSAPRLFVVRKLDKITNSKKHE